MTSPERRPVAQFKFLFGLFLIAGATLMLQVVQTRILSVVSWYHLAFFTISTAMFGLTVGAVWVYLRRDRFTEKTLAYDLAQFSAAFAVATAAALVFQMTLVPVAQLTTTTFVIWFELAVCLAVPFFFSGVVISIALTRSPLPIGRVYGADLTGAAAGSLGALGLLNVTDGPTGVFCVAAIGAIASVLFSASGFGVRPERTRGWWSALLERRLYVVFGLATLTIINHFASIEGGIRPIFVKNKIELVGLPPIFEKWNSFSRVRVYPTTLAQPYLWGPSPTFQGKDWPTSERLMNIDGDAATRAIGLGRGIQSAGFLKYDVTNLGYHLPGRERAAIIGVGGGRDVLSARVFGVGDITGVEINPILVRLLTREPRYADFAGLAGLDGVRFFVDEARSWFARSRETFDVIQMSLVDTWAATGAGAFTLSENGLYTVEAWRIFLRRLNPEGVFMVSRWHAAGEVNETGRMLSLAVATLFAEGATNPDQHIFLASAGTVATLVLSHSPFSAASVATLRGAADRLRFTVLASPGVEAASPVLRTILASRDRAALDRYTSSLELDLSPSTDERPFFFNLLPLDDIGKAFKVATARINQGVASGNLTATWTLIMLFAVSVGLVVCTIVVPLRPAIADAGRKLAVGGTAYFLLIGAGFMIVEIGLMQRLSVFLGHPTFALGIVLFSMILATGLGSMLSDKATLRTPRSIVVWATLTGGYLLSMRFWLHDLVLDFDSAELVTRAIVCILVILPAGVLMGFGFPTGMRLVSAIDRRPMPWFWGINGAASVLASAVAVAGSIALGIGATLTVGAICYFLLIPAALSLAAHGKAAGKARPSMGPIPSPGSRSADPIGALTR